MTVAGFGEREFHVTACNDGGCGGPLVRRAAVEAEAQRQQKAPTIKSVAITSVTSQDTDRSWKGDTYIRKENIEVTVTFSADVTWDLSASNSYMRLRLDIEGTNDTTRTANLHTVGGTSGTARSLKFGYTVGRNDADTDGIFAKPNKGGDMVLLGGGATLTAGGQNADRQHAALTRTRSTRWTAAWRASKGRPRWGPKCTVGGTIFEMWLGALWF